MAFRRGSTLISKFMSKKSLFLVIIQFSSFAFFAVAGSLFTPNYWLIAQIIGLLIALWGVLAMKMGNFNIQPEVKHHANMVSSGPYKIIRNPMYTGLLLFFGISVLVNFTTETFVFSISRVLVFFILAFVLIMKITMEETFLTEKFGESYINYKKKTYRLIPYIY